MEQKVISHSQPYIDESDIEAVVKQLRSKMVSKGNLANHFANHLQDYFNSHFVGLSNSGQTALVRILISLELKAKDEVIIPTYVCSDVYEAVLFVGARPVIVDIDYNYCISVEDIEKHLSEKTRAIICVNIFGINSQICAIREQFGSSKIAVIEDIAQSFGGVYPDGTKHGTIGDFAFGSFQGTKILTSGEGGFFTINNKDFLTQFDAKKEGIDLGDKLSDLAVSLVMNQFEKLNRIIQKRKELASKYYELLKDHSSISILPSENFGMFFRFPIRLKFVFDFETIRNYFESRNIHIRKGVDFLLHWKEKGANCPNAESLFTETISIPIYPSLSIKDIIYVSEVLRDYLIVNHGKI